MCWRIINLSCDNVGTSTHLHNLSDDEGMALRLGRKAQKVPSVAARVQVVISPANVSYLHRTSEDSTGLRRINVIWN